MVRVGAVAINAQPRPLFAAASCCAVASVIAALAAGAPAQVEPLGPVARAEAFLGALRAFRAEVRQRYHDRLHGRDVETAGRLALARPDRLLVRFDGGRGLSLAGDRVTAYDPDVGDSGLVQERTVGDEEFAELRQLLAGTATLADTFDLRELGASSSGEVLEVRPRSRLGWDRALVAIGPSGAPTRLLVVDEAGNTLRWVLEGARSEASLPAGALAFPIPGHAPRIEP